MAGIQVGLNQLADAGAQELYLYLYGLMNRDGVALNWENSQAVEDRKKLEIWDNQGSRETG